MDSTHRIAVFYTGEVRTLGDVIDNFCQNVIGIGSVDVFAVLQSDEPEKYTSMLRTKMGSALKSLQWLDRHDALWIEIRTRQLDQMSISPEWRQYLETSGSMIEYYQMYLAYQAMEAAEKNFKYDLVIRVRCDCMFRRPLETKWFFESTVKKSEIAELLSKIQTWQQHKIISISTLQMFMNSLLDPLRYQNLIPEASPLPISSEYSSIISEFQADTIDRLYDYLIHGQYVVTLRKNIVYVCRRSTFTSIASLGIRYGTSNSYNDPYWFNAECQFRHTCADASIDIFDSCTSTEEKSLYSYAPQNYYDAEGELFTNTSRYLFFLKRH